jgi:osmotically-inducible protein OsmY
MTPIGGEEAMPDTMSNARLSHDVLEELLRDTRIDSSRINVSADDGTVVLRGTVATYYERTAAEQRTWGIAGVRHVHNDLVVDLAGREVLDAELESSARAALDADGLVPKGAVSITAADGWVTMTGNVRHHFQRQAAEHVVGTLRGLRGYTDDVTVSGEPAQDVADGIRSALTRSATIDAGGIRVTDQNGVVTLDGTVRSYAESREAERAAGRAPGVVQITNNLVIAP